MYNTKAREVSESLIKDASHKKMALMCSAHVHMLFVSVLIVLKLRAAKYQDCSPGYILLYTSLWGPFAYVCVTKSGK